jgi:hypothetical protein
MNTARNELAGAGTQTAALGFGGDTPSTVTGVNRKLEWHNLDRINDLNTARRDISR